MTWKAFHNRGEILRAVIATSAVRRDGRLPMDLTGVSETFDDELDLLAALTLKWHTRLSGHIERMLAHQPMDLDEAVAIAWSNTAHELPGVRLIIDHYRDHPADESMAIAMAAATFKERHLLAVMAGRSGLGVEAAERAGIEVEERARALHRGMPAMTPEAVYEEPEPAEHRSLIDRLRAVMAA
ncbi:hypothetical protein ACFQ0K_03725 [Nocardioides caeni]|uniref:Uncharacterized protein n=1 Tax=Nocardioides caeni TaxID=574700 RepID=A0A4S8NMA0_9ACTN|nr:hypothetical protein [Nocardioides caeni]THV18100.1 hypothetical protein E9934_00075 [Nocardioides caeni]